MNKYINIKTSIIPYNETLINIFQKENLKQNFSLLEIGCNVGYNIKELHNRIPNGKYYGIDILEEAIEDAKVECPYGNFIVADLEKDTLPYEKEQFDYIFCPDVLEHLTFPDKVLENLKQYLKSDGVLYACIPNLMFYGVIYNLIIKGKFTYTDTGLLDYDHKHFFTYFEILQTFKKAGYNKISAYTIKVENDKSRDFIRKLSHLSYLDAWQFSTFQYIIKATV